MNFVVHSGSMDNYISLGITGVVSGIIIRRSPWINLDHDYLHSEVEPYNEYFFIFMILSMYFTFDQPKTYDLIIHHNVNLLGIVWSLHKNINYGLLNNMLMFEMTTPVLCMYFITKSAIFVPLLIVMFAYYRVYNCLMHIRYLADVDMVIRVVHVCNTGLNIFWFYKILRKCYNKFMLFKINKCQVE